MRCDRAEALQSDVNALDSVPVDLMVLSFTALHSVVLYVANNRHVEQGIVLSSAIKPTRTCWIRFIVVIVTESVLPNHSNVDQACVRG